MIFDASHLVKRQETASKDSGSEQNYTMVISKDPMMLVSIAIDDRIEAEVRPGYCQDH
jgi:hypothetical protein